MHNLLEDIAWTFTEPVLSVPVCSDHSPEITLQKAYQILAIGTSLPREISPLRSYRHGFSSKNLEIVEGQIICNSLVSLLEHIGKTWLSG